MHEGTKGSSRMPYNCFACKRIHKVRTVIEYFSLCCVSTASSAKQIIHVHKPLKSTLPMRADNDASTYEFVGSLCPAGKSNGQLDFVGCQTDAALVVDPAFNEKRSIIWEEAVEGNIGEEGNTTTATSTTTTTTKTKTTTTTTEAPGDAGNSLAASMTVLALAAMLALPSFWNDNICVLK
jgi:hypothetical protein